MRIKFVALFIGLALAAGCGGTDTGMDNSMDNATPSIVGGTPTEGYPAVASLYAREPDAEKGSLCTGTFISDTVFLTAAHCVHPKWAGANAEFQIWRGHDLTDTLTRCPCHTVAEVHYHSSFNQNNVDAGSDIAVAILAEPIEVDTLPYMQSSLTDSMVGDPAYIVGYGVNNGWGGKGIGIKREATVKLNSYNDLFVKIGRWGKNVCSGDSGGPVIMDVDGDPTVVGVNSFGVRYCTSAASSTRVDSYLPFIEQWL
jgi:secreted trypsin-like serine protease